MYYLCIILFASQNGHVVATGTIFGDELIAPFDGSVVGKSVVSSNGVAINHAETWTTVNGAESGQTRIEREDSFSQWVNIDAVVESVGIGFVDAQIHRSNDGIVDGLNADLVGSVLYVHLVVGHMFTHPTTEEVADFRGHIAHESGHLLFIELF